MFKRILSLFVVVLFVASISFTVSATSTDSYTHIDIIGDKTDLRLSREMYEATKKINATSLGLSESLEGLTDLCVDSANNIYVLCGDESRLIKLASDYSLVSEILVVDVEGNEINYRGAKGIFCDFNGDIYITDTANGRILVCDSNGVLKNELLLPDTKLISKDFLYQPVSIIRDSEGYTYILSLGCYYGVLLYSPNNEFLGFYGSNTVKTTALDTLGFLWDKLTSTESKKEASVKVLPYSFVDFCFDPEGYMITCTGNTSSSNNGKGQIRKISPSGIDILKKRNPKGGGISSSAVNFLEDKLVIKKERTGESVAQNIISVLCSDDNYIFALDKTHGCIYLYDSECNLMSAFGGGYGKGNQLGSFVSPVSMTLNNNDLLVADVSDCSITIFEPTEYGNLFRKAESLYIKGDYEDAEPLWREVLKKDASNQLAHRGLAMVAFNNCDYKTAMYYAKNALDYNVYDMAYSAILSNWIAENFVLIFIVLVIVIISIAVLVVLIKKNKVKIPINENVKIMFETPFHPFRSFELVKYKQKYSKKLTIIITAILFIAFALKETCSGFLYSNTDISSYNVWFTFIGTSGLLLLWSFCNWLVSSTFSGKGSFFEVYTASAYSMLPLIVYTLVFAVLSNILPLSLSGVMTGFGTAVAIITFFLLSIAMITVHEFDFFKFLLTAVVTLFFMILIVFVILMCLILMMQFYTFLKTVYEEVAFR